LHPAVKVVLVALGGLRRLTFAEPAPSRPGPPSRPPSAQRDVDRALRQLLAEGALVELRHQGALQLVALVEEGDPEGEADVAEDLGVLRPR
jgi:hypothetical protein